MVMSWQRLSAALGWRPSEPGPQKHMSYGQNFLCRAEYLALVNSFDHSSCKVMAFWAILGFLAKASQGSRETLQEAVDGWL